MKLTTYNDRRNYLRRWCDVVNNFKINLHWFTFREYFVAGWFVYHFVIAAVTATAAVVCCSVSERASELSVNCDTATKIEIKHVRALPTQHGNVQRSTFISMRWFIDILCMCCIYGINTHYIHRNVYRTDLNDLSVDTHRLYSVPIFVVSAGV